MMALGKNVVIQYTGSIDWCFDPIDAEPRLIQDSIKRIEDIVHFAPATTRNDLFVPQDSVPDLLDRIIKLQHPAKEDRAKTRVAARLLVAA